MSPLGNEDARAQVGTNAISTNPFEESPIKATLRSVLRYSFEHHGYSREECVKLAEIAIEPVAQSLELSQKAYEMHLNALQTIIGPTTCGAKVSEQQVGTNGGLSQRWREQAERPTGPTQLTEWACKRLDADELDAAKLRIEEAVKALPAYLHRGDTGPLSVSSRTAMLKIIREIL